MYVKEITRFLRISTNGTMLQLIQKNMFRLITEANSTNNITILSLIISIPIKIPKITDHVPINDITKDKERLLPATVMAFTYGNGKANRTKNHPTNISLYLVDSLSPRTPALVEKTKSTNISTLQHTDKATISMQHN